MKEDNEFDILIPVFNEDETIIKTLKNIISTVKYNYEVPYGIINRQTDKFNNLLEKPIFSHEINAGIYVLNSKVLKFIKRKYTDIDEVIKLLMKLKQKISVFPIYENWNELSRKKHLKNITEKFSYEK